MVGVTRQAGSLAPASNDAARDLGPDDYLDYDPLPYELALRASYAEQALTFRRRAEKVHDGFDTDNARGELLGNISAHECADLAEGD